jgi:hypothetical protein
MYRQHGFEASCLVYREFFAELVARIPTGPRDSARCG